MSDSWKGRRIDHLNHQMKKKQCHCNAVWMHVRLATFKKGMFSALCLVFRWIPLDSEKAIEDMDVYASEPEVHQYLHKRCALCIACRCHLLQRQQQLYLMSCSNADVETLSLSLHQHQGNDGAAQVANRSAYIH